MYAVSVTSSVSERFPKRRAEDATNVTAYSPCSVTLKDSSGCGLWCALCALCVCAVGWSRLGSKPADVQYFHGGFLVVRRRPSPGEGRGQEAYSQLRQHALAHDILRALVPSALELRAEQREGLRRLRGVHRRGERRRSRLHNRWIAVRAVVCRSVHVRAA